MTQLFQRNYRLTVGTRDITGLDMRFRVEKSTASAPNTASIDVFGLSAEFREGLEKASKIPVKLEAGYGSELMLIYLGEMRHATTTTDGPEILTHIESGDGERQITTSRASVVIPPKTPADIALQQIANTLGVGLGNVSDMAAKLKASGKTLFPAGTVITGSASRALEGFCQSAGLEFSIQDGKLQILEKGKSLDALAFELSSDSGLVGSPTVDSKGNVTAQTLFIPGIRPGLPVVFRSRSVNGGYRIDKCTYTGDTAGNEWFIALECKKISGAKTKKK